MEEVRVLGLIAEFLLHSSYNTQFMISIVLRISTRGNVPTPTQLLHTCQPSRIFQDYISWIIYIGPGVLENCCIIVAVMRCMYQYGAKIYCSHVHTGSRQIAVIFCLQMLAGWKIRLVNVRF